MNSATGRAAREDHFNPRHVGSAGFDKAATAATANAGYKNDGQLPCTRLRSDCQRKKAIAGAIRAAITAPLESGARMSDTAPATPRIAMNGDASPSCPARNSPK